MLLALFADKKLRQPDYVAYTRLWKEIGQKVLRKLINYYVNCRKISTARGIITNCNVTFLTPFQLVLCFKGSFTSPRIPRRDRGPPHVLTFNSLVRSGCPAFLSLTPHKRSFLDSSSTTLLCFPETENGALAGPSRDSLSHNPSPNAPHHVSSGYSSV